MVKPPFQLKPSSKNGYILSIYRKLIVCTPLHRIYTEKKVTGAYIHSHKVLGFGIKFSPVSSGSRIFENWVYILLKSEDKKKSSTFKIPFFSLPTLLSFFLTYYF